MNSKRFRQQMEFLLEVDKAKSIFRQTYISDSSRKENDAEHSWHLAVMAFILSEYAESGTDIARVMKMTLMHDVVEIYAGDTYCYDDKGNADKAERELAAADKIYALLPDDQREEYKALWLEFEEGKTPEAKFANMLDRLQPTMLNYATEGISWKEHGIGREDVLKRNESLINGPIEFSQYLTDLIIKAIDNGYFSRRM